MTKKIRTIVTLATVAAAAVTAAGVQHVDSASAATTSASATATTPTTGSAMPQGNVTANGRTWKQTYKQDFTTPAPLGSFTKTYPNIGTYSGYNDTSGQGLYAPDKVLSVSNGALDFWMHSENGQPLSATILPDNWTAHTTGRVSVRYKSQDTPGYKFVGMFWPSDDNWNEGEIDWPEADMGGTPRPASAIPGSYSNGNMKFLPSSEQFASTNSRGYHTATTEWDHGIVRFYWDGKLVTSTTGAVPTDPMRVTLQAETAIGEGQTPTSSSGHIDINWISIWS